MLRPGAGDLSADALAQLQVLGPLHMFHLRTGRYCVARQDGRTPMSGDFDAIIIGAGQAVPIHPTVSELIPTMLGEMRAVS